ncbi:MAG: NAD(P)-dependent oxidoreductase [Pseudomonadota bacterium]
MASRILLTGITSYPGRELARRLLADGSEVHAVVRPGSTLERIAGIGKPILHTDDGAAESLVRILGAARPEVVFHLAGHYVREHGPGDIDRIVGDNILFGCRLLEAMRQTGARRIVNTGSYFQFRNGTPRDAVNLYAAAKWAFADILDYYAGAAEVESTTLVLYDTYGPGDWRPRLMQAVRAAAKSGIPLPLTAADMPMNFVHIDDVGAAFIRAAELLAKKPESVRGRHFAVRPRAPSTIEDIVAAYERVNACSIVRRWGAYPVPSRGSENPWQGPTLPGWEPTVSLDEGLRRLGREG